ncbi:MAG: IS21 family transposase [Myxococcales bacterium FL481]|nr:MAG: IS21 family transposase [Myxococcales bacterium FL481]
MEAEILRLHFAEKWPMGTIARQLGIHHSVVRRVLGEAGQLVARKRPRPMKTDPYMDFIRETLEAYPKLCASRLYVMLKERGFDGSESRLRHVVRPLRPKPRHEAYLRLRTLPGEQGQVDWGHFGKLRVGRAKRTLLAFVIVLAWSRRIFLRFFLSARMPSFLRGHIEAFRAFGGSPRVLLYDNLKSAVLERRGDAIRFNPRLLELAGHYRFRPRACAPGRGNEKGGVERAIRYIRTSFFAARSFTDLDDLNAQARAWCEGEASERLWPDDRERRVREVFAEEQAKLLALPDDDFPCAEQVAVRAGKSPYVRFDLNDYSVPHTHVRRELSLVADLETVRVCDGPDVIATHARSWSKGERVEDPAHIADLVARKRNARAQRGLDRLYRAAPNTETLLVRAAERGMNLGSTTARLLVLLDHYGAAALDDAVAEVNEREVVHVPSVRQLLEQRRCAASRPPLLPVHLPPDPRIRDLVVRPHDLKTYDALADISESSEEPSDDA